MEALTKTHTTVGRYTGRYLIPVPVKYEPGVVSIIPSVFFHVKAPYISIRG